MTQEELKELRQDFVSESNQKLQEIYLEHKAACVNLLLSKKYCDKETAEDIFCDAAILFRKNVISKKIEKLTKVKSYLTATCLNMAKERKNRYQRNLKKSEEVRLLLYGDTHITLEDTTDKAEMLEVCRVSLSRLTERCQKILTAFYVYGLSMKEIAIDLSLSSSDVSKTLKQRCYKKWMEEANMIKQNKK